MTRDRAFLARRRKTAARLFRQGKAQVEVARDLGVSRATAMRWFDQWEATGRIALAENWGRPRRLTPGQEQLTRRAMLQGPRVHGFSTNRWTARAIAELIENVAGVRFHCDHAWKLWEDLRGLDWVEQARRETAGTTAS